MHHEERRAGEVLRISMEMRIGGMQDLDLLVWFGWMRISGLRIFP